MPTIALGYYAAPAFMRLIRAGMIVVLEADYIRTARAKGLPSNKVIFKHALRNAVVPVVIGMRYAAGLPFRWDLFPVFVAAYFGGQYVGSRWRLRRSS